MSSINHYIGDNDHWQYKVIGSLNLNCHDFSSVGIHSILYTLLYADKLFQYVSDQSEVVAGMEGQLNYSKNRNWN